MFIYTLKGQNIKLIISFVLSAAVIILSVMIFPTRSNDYVYPDEVLPAAGKVEEKDFKNISTNEDRIDFLKLYGWEVEPEATEVVEVIVPPEFDPVYERYNQLQISEGLDLRKYKGKSVKKYTYLVCNYDYDGTVLANLIIYKDRVIGGDICSLDTDGFVHGLTKGNDFLT